MPKLARCRAWSQSCNRWLTARRNPCSQRFIQCRRRLQPGVRFPRGKLARLPANQPSHHAQLRQLGMKLTPRLDTLSNVLPRRTVLGRVGRDFRISKRYWTPRLNFSGGIEFSMLERGRKLRLCASATYAVSRWIGVRNEFNFTACSLKNNLIFSRKRNQLGLRNRIRFGPISGLIRVIAIP